MARAERRRGERLAPWASSDVGGVRAANSMTGGDGLGGIFDLTCAPGWMAGKGENGPNPPNASAIVEASPGWSAPPLSPDLQGARLPTQAVPGGARSVSSLVRGSPASALSQRTRVL